jgi:mRNA interferase MazF
VAEFVGGDVVVVPFPFTNLQSSTRRPAVVLATFARGDLLICQITSRSESHPTAVAIGTDDFTRGGIDRPSVALPHRLVAGKSPRRRLGRTAKRPAGVTGRGFPCRGAVARLVSRA